MQKLKKKIYGSPPFYFSDLLPVFLGAGILLWIVLSSISCCGDCPDWPYTEDDTSTGTDTDSDADTDTDTDSDADTDTDTGSDLSRCPWTCKNMLFDEEAQFSCAWFKYPESLPTLVRNWDYSCEDRTQICCQPVDATKQGALKDYCDDIGGTCGLCSDSDSMPAFCYSANARCCR